MGSPGDGAPARARWPRTVKQPAREGLRSALTPRARLQGSTELTRKRCSGRSPRQRAGGAPSSLRASGGSTADAHPRRVLGRLLPPLSCVRVPSYPVPQHDARWLRRELRLPGPHEGLRPLRLHRSPRAVGAHPPRCGMHRRLLRQLVPLHVVRAPRASAGPVDAICFCVCHFLFCVRVCLR